MLDNENCLPVRTRTPWNKGKLIGARPPLRPKHVWSIRTRLLLEGRVRDLATFNLAIDSKLRGCDVVALKVEDVAPNGYAVDRAAKKDRATSQVRADRSNSSSRRRIPEGRMQETRQISIHGSARLRSVHDYAAICTASVGMDRQYRAGPKTFCYAFPSANKGNADLPPNRQPASRTALARPHQD